MVKRVIKDSNIPNLKPSVACIGFFDGVHLGHQLLIKQTIKQAQRLNVKSCLICFDPNPMEVIKNFRYTHITDLETRLDIIKAFGIDQVIVIKFTEEFMKITPKQFITRYLNKMNILTLICGFDFTFGFHGVGNITHLIKYGKFETIVIPEYKIGNRKVSSTRIRLCFLAKNFRLTNKLLGWDYYLELVVVKCTKKGKKWIVETVPKDPYIMLPTSDKYGDSFEVVERKVYITGPKRLKKGQILLVSFTNEQVI